MTNAVRNIGTLQVTTPSEREIAMTRVFDASRSLVFDAWTRPELLKRWLGVRGGWTFAVCEVEALDTTTFVERGGKTTATTTVLYASRAVRDAVLKTPMLTGVAESYDKMAELLASRVGQPVK
jgi:uncharacterized protein YndB with AHSA1/START domain